MQCASAFGATLFSETFNTLTPALASANAGSFKAVGQTNIDILGGSLYGNLCVAPASGNCVDLGGTGGNPQGILQTQDPISLQPGISYMLSFDLLGSGRGNATSTTVSFAGYSSTFVLGSSDRTGGVVTNAIVTVPVATSAYLTFRNNTSGNSGAILDNVQITSSADLTQTAEPGGLMLLGICCLTIIPGIRRVLRNNVPHCT
jgi:hypothetical protein